MFFDPMIAHALLRESKSMYPVLQEASEFYHKGYELDQPAIAKGAHAGSITSAGRYDYPVTQVLGTRLGLSVSGNHAYGSVPK